MSMSVEPQLFVFPNVLSGFSGMALKVFALLVPLTVKHVAVLRTVLHVIM